MKKLIFAAFIFAATTVTAVAQTKKNSEISVCKMTKTSVTMEELEKCNMIFANDDKLKIKSFTASFLVKGDDGKDVYMDVDVAGNQFNQTILDILKNRNRNISKILIDKVIAVDASKNEKKLNGTQFDIKK